MLRSRLSTVFIFTAVVLAPIAACGQSFVGLIMELRGRVVAGQPSAQRELKVRDGVMTGEPIVTGDGASFRMFLGGPAGYITVLARTRLSLEQTPRRTIFSIEDGGITMAEPFFWQEGARDLIEVRTRHAVTVTRGAAMSMVTGEMDDTRICVSSGSATVRPAGDEGAKPLRVDVSQCVTATSEGLGPLEPLDPQRPGRTTRSNATGES